MRLRYATCRKGTMALLIVLCSLFFSPVRAQIGEYRNEFAVGINGGVSMSKVDFLPEVPQDQLMGPTSGLTMRYTVEKYFKSICAIVAEVAMMTAKNHTAHMMRSAFMKALVMFSRSSRNQKAISGANAARTVPK